MSEATTNHVHVGKGGFVAFGDKIGLIENSLSLAGTTAGNSEQVFVFDSDVLVLAAGVEITTALSTSCTIDLGTAEDGTQFVSAQAADVAVGTQLAVATTVPVVVASGGQISITVDGATAVVGAVRVWAIIADIEALDGD